MTGFDVRRLAAVDMHGVAGTTRRRRLILAEFLLAVPAGLAAGIPLAASTGGWWRLLGAWAIGAGLNYLPLALHALSLSRPGALAAELRGVDIGRELRRYSAAQFWTMVPLALVTLDLRQRRQPVSRAGASG